MNDLEFIQTQIADIMKESSLYADKDNSTKKEFIIRLKEKVSKLFELENRAISEIASFIAKKIEESLTFPGQIKVTVIREMRAVEYANK